MSDRAYTKVQAQQKKLTGLPSSNLVLQRAAVNSTPFPTSPVFPIVQSVLKSPGQPLNASMRAFMEPRFGYDFSQVRVHTDEEAVKSARAINALAYTVGRDIVFGEGQYAPETMKGRRLLAHELTHAVQQNSSKGLVPSSMPRDTVGSVHEQEAERAVQHVQQGFPVQVQSHASGMIQCYGHDVSSCKQEDLGNILWPGDALAREMVKKVLAALGMDPCPRVVSKLLKDYFMTETPNIATIRANFQRIQDVFSKSEYIYVCREDCESKKEIKTLGVTTISWSGWGSPYGPTYLCMNNLRTQIRPDVIAASTIIHEFCHRWLNFNSIDNYCEGPCQGIKPEQALVNPDSYANFALDLHWAAYNLKKNPELKNLTEPEQP